MDSVIKMVMKRLLLLQVCSIAVTVLLAREFSHGVLSPRGLGIALLMVCIAIGVGFVLIKRSAKELTIPSGQSESPVDDVTRKRLIWRLRAAKTMIVLMGVGLVFGFTQVRNGLLFPLLVGLVMNLLITAKSVQTVVRLKRILG